MSQLDLSLRADVSTRHLSFIENGRANPTPEMIDRLAEHLDVPLRERNELLMSAGFAPAHPERPLSAPELLAVSSAFRQILDAHGRHPALVLDRHWDVLDRNQGTDVLLQGCTPELLEPPINAVRVSLHPGGIAPRIRNLPQWSAHLLAQVRARWAHTGDPQLHLLLEEALTYPGVTDGHSRALATDVVVPLELSAGSDVLRFFSISAAVESALDVTVDELRIEAFYPADDATACLLATETG